MTTMFCHSGFTFILELKTWISLQISHQFWGKGPVNVKGATSHNMIYVCLPDLLAAATKATRVLHHIERLIIVRIYGYIDNVTKGPVLNVLLRVPHIIVT